MRSSLVPAVGAAVAMDGAIRRQERLKEMDRSFEMFFMLQVQCKHGAGNRVATIDGREHANR